MQFDLTDLRLFVRCAEDGAITRAATREHLSLAAASVRVKTLEDRVGLPLLYREARGVRLTPAGEAFFRHARAVLRQTEQLRADLLEFGTGLRGRLRVFANTTAVTDFLPELLPEFLAAHPRVDIDLQERANADIARGVRDGRADLGIVAGHVDTMGLRAIHFSTDRLVLVVPKGHPLARQDQVAFADTLDEDHIGMHEGSTLQAYLTQIADQMGRSLRHRIQLSGFDAICRMVGAGVGVAVVPESAAHRNLLPMRLAQVELSDSWRWRDRYILVREQATLPAFADALIDSLAARFGPPSRAPSPAPTPRAAPPAPARRRRR
ncbi:MAG TPA: LysR substrate-binding domain-containing protein [Ottowia sp.]|nr:LysR substrate-binding domain-containing protein [Ottowia sp.]